MHCDTQSRIVDANEAVASVAHRASEVIAIYPITPSSAMAEWADEWSSQGRRNLWGNVPQVLEMQSEAGAAGVVHGAVQTGAIATTFTASQGLLLMIPNMFKIAGELTPLVMHVTARAVATHALSIFGDHSDVMACRQTGFAMLSAASVQEAQDFACIAHAATLLARIPFLHFFDGFRTSHEVTRVTELSDDTLRAMLDEAAITAHRSRSLTPDRPTVRGTAQNPDVFFQAREACNRYYDACPSIVRAQMEHFAALTGRHYQLFDYVGHPEAERVVIIMGSGAEVAHETVEWLLSRGERVGVLKVRLFRPFSTTDFMAAIPSSARRLAVLDRTKEPGATGEPLYLDVIAALRQMQDADEEAGRPTLDRRVIHGRYGLASKEFTPAMVKAVFDELAAPRPRGEFTVGIVDDVTHLSLPVDAALDIEPGDVTRAVFFGLGADGTVGANKNSIKIIGEQTSLWPQGYFVYDSKKSGAVTVSHLRFGPRPIRSSYLIRRAHFVACHQYGLLEKLPVLDYAADGATFLLNAPFTKDEIWDQLPREMQEQIREKHLRFYVIDGHRVASNAGLGGRINTIMQACFFALSGVLPRDEAIAKIKQAIQKSYGKKGTEAINRNFAAVDRALENLHEVSVPAEATTARRLPPLVSDEAPDFVRRVTAVMLAGKGDLLSVSAFPPDGVWPTATSRWEKRDIALNIPVWDATLCIQCNKCALACPHAAIRAKVYEPELLQGAPATFKSALYKATDFKGQAYSLQVAPEDCTGCSLCVAVCPAKDKSNPRHRAIDMMPQARLREAERANFKFFLDLPEVDRAKVRIDVKGSQFLQPLFEFSGACAGCGETPYIKLMTQLFGDRLLVANATGCSSIYGGNLPTTPYCTNAEGRGPAWANSLFEDNAEFGLGFRVAVDQHKIQASDLLRRLAGPIGQKLVDDLLMADQSTEAGIAAQRQRVGALRQILSHMPGDSTDARRLELLCDYLVKKSVWIVGGDGWAYDIGYGGLDHVLATGRDVNVLVLDTEVYSNTGGQQSKSTPMGAVAKFAAAGKAGAKKDLGMMAMCYGNVYVAHVAFGAKDVHTVKALLEAEAYPGPSLVIAYSHCIAHGYDMSLGAEQQRLAVESGTWPLYRFDPRRAALEENPLELDSTPPRISLKQYALNEMRFRMLQQQDPERFDQLMQEAQRWSTNRFTLYQQIAQFHTNGRGNGKDDGHAAVHPKQEVVPAAGGDR